MARIVGQVYAQALFELCVDQKNETIVHNELLELKEIFDDNSGFLALVSNPTISHEEKLNIVDSALKGNISATTLNFFKLLCDKNRAMNFVEIQEHFEHLYNDKNNIISVKAKTCIKLNDALLEKLKLKLQDVMGKNITIENVVDKTILGGIVLEYSNYTVTATVKNKLEEIRKSLMTAYV